MFWSNEPLKEKTYEFDIQIVNCIYAAAPTNEFIINATIEHDASTHDKSFIDFATLSISSVCLTSPETFTWDANAAPPADLLSLISSTDNVMRVAHDHAKLAANAGIYTGLHIFGLSTEPIKLIICSYRQPSG